MAAEEQKSWLLHDACGRGDAKRVAQLLRQSTVDDINQTDNIGYTALHHACANPSVSRMAVIDQLVSRGADVNIRTLGEGDTALHLVLRHSTSDEAMVLVLELLSKGADAGYRNDKFRCPYDIAMAREFFEVAEFLQDPPAPDECTDFVQKFKRKNYAKKLIESVLESKEEDVKACLRLGADCNLIDEQGAGALHYCITHSKLDKVHTVKSLLKAGANVNLLDYEQDNALNLVLKTRELRDGNQTMYQLVRLLMQHGADTQQKDLDGNDAFTIARTNQYFDLLDLLRSTSATRRSMSSGSDRGTPLSRLDDEFPQPQRTGQTPTDWQADEPMVEPPASAVPPPNSYEQPQEYYPNPWDDENFDEPNTAQTPVAGSFNQPANGTQPNQSNNGGQNRAGDANGNFDLSEFGLPNFSDTPQPH